MWFEATNEMAMRKNRRGETSEPLTSPITTSCVEMCRKPRVDTKFLILGKRDVVDAFYFSRGGGGGGGKTSEKRIAKFSVQNAMYSIITLYYYISIL